MKKVPLKPSIKRTFRKSKSRLCFSPASWSKTWDKVVIFTLSSLKNLFLPVARLIFSSTDTKRKTLTDLYLKIKLTFISLKTENWLHVYLWLGRQNGPEGSKKTTFLLANPSKWLLTSWEFSSLEKSLMQFAYSNQKRIYCTSSEEPPLKRQKNGSISTNTCQKRYSLKV